MQTPHRMAPTQDLLTVTQQRHVTVPPLIYSFIYFIVGYEIENRAGIPIKQTAAAVPREERRGIKKTKKRALRRYDLNQLEGLTGVLKTDRQKKKRKKRKKV